MSNPARKAGRKFWAAAPIVLLWALPVHAQQLFPANSSFFDVAPEPISPGIAPAAVMPATPEAKNDRLFFLLPNYLMVEDRDYVEPLTAKRKFELSGKTMTDPVTISFLGAIALLGQARNSDSSYR